jgi:hypothetical protein
MKKIITLFISVLVGVLAVYSVQKFNLVKFDKSVVSYNVSTMDSITFSSDNAYLSIFRSGITAESYLVSEIDSIYFSGSPDTVYITFSGSSATIENPLENQGVSVSVSGADVVVYSTVADNEVRYLLKGTSTDGSVKFYGNYKSEIILSGLTLTNPTGPAINNQSKKRTTVTLAAGTTNSLTDGSTYDSSAEDQKGTFFSEGQLIFTGTGNLSVKGNKGHAICSDDYIEIEGGVITVSGAVKDGIHSKDHFNLENGTVLISATGDAVECEAGKIKVEGGSLTSTISSSDAKGLKCDSTLTVSGGTINLTVTGNQAKGLKSGGIMSLSGGKITVNTSGAAVLTASGSGYDPSYCTAIKGDSTIIVDGSAITITGTGAGSKGISVDGALSILSGTIGVVNSGAGAVYTNALGATDSYNATCLGSDVSVTILAGTINCSASGAGGKTLKSDGAVTIGSTSTVPVISFTTTGSKFTVSSSGSGPNATVDYCHPKTIVSDGAIVINSGDLTVSSSNDGIHSETSITINGGNVNITGSYEGIESKIINLVGGTTNTVATNDGLNATMGAVAGGTESNDGSLLNITGGTHYISCTNGDAIDSNGNITMTGGVVFANGPSSGVEEAVDFNGTFNINGGTFVGAGSNSNMTKAMSASSAQPGMYITSSSQIAASTMLTVATGGTGRVSFKPKYGAYKFLISTPAMVKGASYVIYTGGSYTGETTSNGLYYGGIFSSSGATSKKSGTLSSSSTVNTISF